ncbi:hypothetical protein D9M69_693880 [compost metagenome]
MRDKVHFYVVTQQRLDDLTRDFGTLTLIRRSKGLIEEHHRVGPDCIGYAAHPS